MLIGVPESVRAYFERPELRTAVDLLVSNDRPDVPEGIAWPELPQFYRAILAARQTQVDYALLLAEAWDAVWDEPGNGWQACSPQAPGRRDASVSLETVWHEGCFTRRFIKGRHALELCAYLEDRSGFQFGIGLFEGRKSGGPAEIAPEWDSEGSDYIWSPLGSAPIAEEISLAALRGQATEALQRLHVLKLAD